jgi:replicative DNA helicase
MVIELSDDQVVEVVVTEMANIIDDKFAKEDLKYAATRIVQYYLRTHEYEEFSRNRESKRSNISV